MADAAKVQLTLPGQRPDGYHILRRLYIRVRPVKFYMFRRRAMTSLTVDAIHDGMAVQVLCHGHGGGGRELSVDV